MAAPLYIISMPLCTFQYQRFHTHSKYFSIKFLINAQEFHHLINGDNKGGVNNNLIIGGSKNLSLTNELVHVYTNRGNPEDAIVRRLIDFAKTMPRGRNFLGFMPFLNDAGAQAHRVCARSSTREQCARFFGKRESCNRIKPFFSGTVIYIVVNLRKFCHENLPNIFSKTL